MQITTTIHIESENYPEISTQEIELEIQIEADYSPPCKGSRDYYGAPLEPDTEAEVEIYSASFQGEEITLTEADKERAKWACLDSLFWD